MKKTMKPISLLLALVLALSMLGSMTVFADEQPAADAAASQSIQPAENAGEQNAGAGTAPDTSTPGNSVPPTPSPTPDPTPEPEGMAITYYAVDGFEGGHYSHGEQANILVTFIDEWANAHGANITARINTDAFRAPDQAAVHNADGTYSVFFPNVTYAGGSTTFSLELLYDQPREVKVLTQEFSMCDDSWSTPEPSATPAPTTEPNLPKIMVKDFTFGGTSVPAGKEFELDLTLFTTSGNTNLQDVMVGLTFPPDTKNISLATGSMNTYVGEMAPGATRHIKYKMITDATMEPGSVPITVQLSSKNGEGSTFPISIPVTQPERFEITNMEAPDTMLMGDEGYLSVTFVNKGKSPINNLSAEIQGDNLANPGQSQFLGNIAPGTENSVDFSVMAAGEGVITGKVVLSYENSKGETQTLTKEFSCTVEAMPPMDPGMDLPEMPDEMVDGEAGAGMPWWGWLLIAAGVAGVVAAVVIVLKKKKAKKQAQLEDEDEDI